MKFIHWKLLHSFLLLHVSLFLFFRVIYPQQSFYAPDGDEDDNEENDVLRVPIAVAIVKLLSILPSKTFLRRNLPSVLLRVIVFLKSRFLTVRETARSALVKIITILGPWYVSSIKGDKYLVI